MQEQIVAKKLKLYVIDAYEVANKANMGVRINTVMQTCFFAIAGMLPKDEAIKKIETRDDLDDRAKAIRIEFGLVQIATLDEVAQQELHAAEMVAQVGDGVLDARCVVIHGVLSRAAVR